MPVSLPPQGSPGVYIQEIDSGPRPIEAVGTSTPAFVGFAPRTHGDRANKPVLVTSWSDFVEKFGSVEVDKRGRRHLRPHLPNAYLSYAVYGFFANGGSRCYVVALAPVVDGANALPSVTLPALAEGKRALVLTARNADDTPIHIEVETTPSAPAAADGEAAQADGGTFTLRISSGDTREEYSNLSFATRPRTRGVADQLKDSRLITVADGDADVPAASRLPKPGIYDLQGQALAELPPTRASDFVGDIIERSGIEGLEAEDEINMICVPDLMAAYNAHLLDAAGVKDVQTSLIGHCERLKNRMVILDPLPDKSPQEMQDWLGEMNFSSEFAVLYYPWLKVPGADGEGDILVPPSGHVAGIWARTDATRGVHKAPANEVVQNVTDLAVRVTRNEQAGLNPLGINCIRSLPGQGIRVWGARTLSGDASWRYVSVRRLFNMIEESIERSTQWVVFEPNDANLWARVKRDIDAFLTVQWRGGALFGAKPAQAFFVKCDETNNPAEQRDLGYLVVDIGLAPVKPAEFVVFRFQQVASSGA